MPDTTPMAKATAKVLGPEPGERMEVGLSGAPPEHQERGDNAETPMLKAGKMMWKLMVKGELQARQQQGVSFHPELCTPSGTAATPPPGDSVRAGPAQALVSTA